MGCTLRMANELEELSISSRDNDAKKYTDSTHLGLCVLSTTGGVKVGLVLIS
jgi:hypothetical protein